MKEGQGEDDRFAIEIDQVGGGVFPVETAENMNVQTLEQLFRGFDERGGIVVSGNDDAVAYVRDSTSGEEPVVKFDRPVGRHRDIKKIAGNNDARDLFFPDQVQQKIQHGVELVVTLCIVEGCAQMPVCSMQDLHRAAFVLRRAVV